MKILVGYDGTKAAVAAARLAKQRAESFGGSVDVVQVIAQDRNMPYEEINRTEDRLKREIAKIFQGAGVNAETHLLVSANPAGEELVDYADRIAAEEIVLGLRRRSKVGKFVSGSTSQYVVLNAQCPVVTTR